jgi:O-antigen/teichoic acid export membrane protein
LKKNILAMSNKTKALLYNLICFAAIFVVIRLILGEYSGLEGYWLPITTFVVSTIISPKFQAVTTRDGDNIFMRWMFIKGIKKF